MLTYLFPHLTDIQTLVCVNQNKYFIYKLNSDGTIVKMNEGLVELNSLEKGISQENSKNSLEQIVKSL